MATVQEWVDDISRDFPDALETVVGRATRYALQDFFKRSEAWRHHERITLVSGTNEYVFPTLPFDTYAIASAYCYLVDADGKRRKLSATLKHRIDPDVSGSTGSFAVDSQSVHIDGEVTSGELDICVILQPTRTIDDIPDELADPWFDCIRHGAVARLMISPDKPWTDLKNADLYERMFNDGVLRAKREARDDRSRPKRSVRFNSGFYW